MSEEKKDRTWEDHWAEGHIPWDAGESSPSLEACLKKLGGRTTGRALVAGCGSGYDVFALARAGYEAIGVDLAPSAAPRFTELRQAEGLSEAQARLVTGDFFALDEAALGGRFDFIWDYTFYCAIPREMRDAWREQMARLLTSDGTLAMLLFPVVPGAPEDQGPPFPLDPEKVTAQLSPRLSRISLEKAKSSHEGREGKEWLSLWKLG